MKENELEHLLETICREQIDPPEHLVANTKQRVKRNRLFNVVVFLSLLLNALVTIFTVGLIFWPGAALTNKILWYFGSTTVFNGLIILISLNQEKVTAFFSELTYAVNH